MVISGPKKLIEILKNSIEIKRDNLIQDMMVVVVLLFIWS